MERLIVGPCPICGKTIIEIKDGKGKENQFYDEIFVKFNDENKTKFAICKDCKLVIAQEQLDELMKRQIYTWGIEVAQQFKWYYEQAVHLKIIKKADTENGL